MQIAVRSLFSLQQRSAINNTGKVVLKNHMNHCIVEAVEEHDMEAIEQLNKAIDQFMK